ncbi:MAG: DNA gyrase inhibitor YacG [Rhodocyclaceae bacterium]
MPEEKRPARTVACPQCGAAAVWNAQNPYRPFCSERCKLIDLGAWASESYRVAGTETPPEEER